MKKIVSLLLILAAITHSCFGQIRAEVDERFELTSIAFMLAGAPEYNDCRITSYKKDMEDRFGKYRSTEPIAFMRELNRTHLIGYNALTTVADVLQIKNGKISLKPQYNLSDICERDPRWSEPLLEKYIVMLNRFYKDSRFDRFFSDHRELYRQAEEGMNTLLDKTHTRWFEDFFGRPLEAISPEVYLSLVNGPNNYAMGESSVLIGVGEDRNGVPDPNNPGTRFTLIHEWGHHFTNPIVNHFWPRMENAAERIYPYLESAMNRLAYSGAKAMTIEWMNNLFALMYYRETAPERVPGEMSALLHRGFIWMDRSVDFMEYFYSNRERYPNIESFMPQIVGFFEYVAGQFDIIYREYKNGYPFITNVYPAWGTDISGFDQIEITFSRPMLGSWGFKTSTDDENDKDLPIRIEDVRWSEDMMKAYIPLDMNKIVPDTSYRLRLSIGFRSTSNFPLDEKCTNLLFYTGQK